MDKKRLENCLIRNEFKTRYTVHGRGANRPEWANLPLSTVPNFLDSSSFSQVTQSTSGICFCKSSKDVSKSGSKTERFANDITLWPFFSTFLKSGFQNLTVLRDVSTPHTSPAKSNYFPDERMAGRTDGRNICFWLADERKERFAQ